MQIYLLVTDNCNLNCQMCIRGNQVGRDLDYDQLKGMKWLLDLKDHDIVVTGGEPTLHKDFEKIVDLLTSHAKTVTITSNGTLNSYIKQEFLRENLYFQISIDGDMPTHNAIRGQGSYEKSMETIVLLDALNAQYSVASVVNKHNTGAIKLLEKDLRKLDNIRYWKVSYEMPFGSAGFDNMMTAEEWNGFVDDLIDCARLRLKIKKIFSFDLYDKRKEALDLIHQKGVRSNNCGSGKSKLYIYPDWTVYSCTCLTDFPLGNLSQLGMGEILAGDPIRKFISYECMNPICKGCKYFKYCNGGCIGMSHHYYGKLGMGDIRCPILREKTK